MSDSETVGKLLADQRREIVAMDKAVNKIIKLDQSREANLDKLEAELNKLEKGLAQSQFPESTYASLQFWIGNLRQSIEKSRHDLDRKFGSRLAELLAGLEIELQGQIPELRAGIFTVEVDSVRNRVVLWFGPKQERLEVLARSPELVAKAIRNQLKSLNSSDLNEQDFLKRCLAAYKRVITLEGKGFGSPAPISQLLAELAFLMQGQKFMIDPDQKNYRGYSRVQLSFDLHRLASRRIENLELRLITATREKTTHRKNFLWVPQTKRGSGSYYSGLAFREEHP